ncbi:uncharacterized protein EV422DRAFT_218545 [Fimicolochytrium jonesii]|uniref:uncharacterized protein n=1 Tax=Fimicolochytrium jonesii TaxID=1396493 RepID=UPI0022FDD51F|nr:uncharacterized protein EV422DRAFT_218545 [Fimicolochytrium jonesii]KAI8817569.1 hypothetical protein EV422DRAFT_218545 [Fimicolochytrium jonesii]
MSRVSGAPPPLLATRLATCAISSHCPWTIKVDCSINTLHTVPVIRVHFMRRRCARYISKTIRLQRLLQLCARFTVELTEARLHILHSTKRRPRMMYCQGPISFDKLQIFALGPQRLGLDAMIVRNSLRSLPFLFGRAYMNLFALAMQHLAVGLLRFVYDFAGDG